MARRSAVVLGLLMAFVPPAVAVVQSSGRATNQAQRPGEAATLFSQKCAACHGPAGVPNAAMAASLGIPDMTDPKGVTTKPDIVLRASVTAGKGKMPAFGAVLTPAQIRSLVTYVKSLRQRRAR